MEFLKQEELSSLKSQNVSRALSFGQTTVSGDSRLEDDSSYDETDQHGSSMITKEAKGIVRLSTKQVHNIFLCFLSSHIISFSFTKKVCKLKYDNTP